MNGSSVKGAAPAARDAGIDVARGLAMLLVVLGHNAAFVMLAPATVAWFYTFHVAAFFFVSGALLRPERFDAARTARRILLPFVVVGLLLAVLKALWRGEGLANPLLGLLWGTGATVPSSQLWFLPALFGALLLAVGIARAGFRAQRPILALTVLTALLLLAWLALQLPPPAWAEPLRRPKVVGTVGWLWSIDLLPLASFFVLAGYGAAAAGWLARLRPWMALPAFVVVTVCFALGARMDMNLRLVSPFALAILAALAGSVALWAGGQAIARHAPAAGGPALTRVGRHSMLILVLHVVVQNAAVDVAQRVLGDGTAALAATTVAGLLAGVLLPMALSMGIDRMQFRPPGARTR